MVTAIRTEFANKCLGKEGGSLNTIVLASGGVDSTLVMLKLLDEGHTVYPFFANYHQYSLENEKKSIYLVEEWILDTSYVRGGSNRIKEVTEIEVGVGIPQIAACPGRVLSFVGAAAIWAFTKGWTEGNIAIGIHKGDKDQDSCRVGYEDSLEECLSVLTQNQLHIITPLMGMTREEMAFEVAKYGVPWDIIYNCYWGVPCGWQSKNMNYLCPGCRRKREAMVITGYKGPLLDRPNCGIMDTLITRRDWKKLV